MKKMKLAFIAAFLTGSLGAGYAAAQHNHGGGHGGGHIKVVGIGAVFSF